MPNGLDHDNHRNLGRIAVAMEGIVKELVVITERMEAAAGVAALPAEDVQAFAQRIHGLTLAGDLSVEGRLAAVNEIAYQTMRGRGDG